MSVFVEAYKEGGTELHHRDGVAWYDAPRPSRWHRCRIQTKGYVMYFDFVARCACGAISSDGKRWDERNSRGSE